MSMSMSVSVSVSLRKNELRGMYQHEYHVGWGYERGEERSLNSLGIHVHMEDSEAHCRLITKRGTPSISFFLSIWWTGHLSLSPSPSLSLPPSLNSPPMSLSLYVIHSLQFPSLSSLIYVHTFMILSPCLCL